MNEKTPLNATSSLEFDIEERTPFSKRSKDPNIPRWSVLDMETRQTYCKNCFWFCGLCTFRSVLATGMLVVLIILLLSLPKFMHRLAEAEEPATDRYDFIIVGGGGAGTLMASKLAGSGFDVLILEAGPYAGQYSRAEPVSSNNDVSVLSLMTIFAQIPFLWSSLVETKDILWSGFFNSTVQAAAKTSSPYLQSVLLGRGIGGSELLSSMIYMRALESDINSWVPLDTEDDLIGTAGSNGTTPTPPTLTPTDTPAVLAFDYFNMLKTYIALENYQTSSAGSSSQQSMLLSNDITTAGLPVHGAGGPLQTSRPIPHDSLLATSFITAATAAAGARLPFLQDFNDVVKCDERLGGISCENVDRIGVGYYDFTIGRDGFRSSAGSNLLQSLAPEDFVQLSGDASKDGSVTEALTQSAEKSSSKNSKKGSINVGLHASVTSILLEPLQADSFNNGKRVPLPSHKTIGVSYVQFNGMQKQVLLRSDSVLSERCVILAAGAINTPKLLLNSGVGSVEAVRGPHLVNNPNVGKHLRDHPFVGVVVAAKPQLCADLSTANDVSMELMSFISQAEARNRSLTGVLGTPGFSAGGFLQSPYSSKTNVPDLQLTIYPTVSDPHMALVSSSKASGSKQSASAKSEGCKFLIAVQLLHPEAEYEISLDRSDPINKSPLIVSESTLTNKDIETLQWGVEMVRQIIAGDTMKDLVDGERVPGQSIVDDKLHDWVEANVMSSWDFVGTAGMGRSPLSSADITDDISVVDERLRVRGIHGLRIADASVIPSPISGNPHATVLAVSSILSDMIAADMAVS